MSPPHDAEREALREIAGEADILNVNGQPYILAPVSPATVDALAALDADTEDMEPNGDDEPSIGSDDDLEADNSDYEPDDDDERDYLDQPVPDYPNDPERPQIFEPGKPLVMANPDTGELGRWESLLR